MTPEPERGGLALINDLIESDKKFLYGGTDFALIQSQNYERFGMTADEMDRNQGIVNASNGGSDGSLLQIIGDDWSTNRLWQHRPQEGYDGQVVVSSNASWTEGAALLPKSRASVIFHELAENYERTHNGIDYRLQNGKGAHILAVEREKKWWGRSRTPGGWSGYVPRRSSPARREVINGIIIRYESTK